ncbi:MAG: DUF4153 domain-containing protein [Cardiobacterium sp.]
MLRRLPAFTLVAAPLLGVFYALGLYYGERLFFTFGARNCQFFMLNGGLMVMLNWRLLSEPGVRRKAWTGTLLLLAFTTLCHAYIQQRFHVFSDNYYRDFAPAILLSTVTQTGALLLATFCEKHAQRPADIALAVCANRFIFNGLLYGLFIALTALILGLGFALLRLVNIDLWRLLGEPGQQILIGLCGGVNLLILNLAPLPERERPFPYLHIFQYIALAFALFYLAVLPFASEHIDSGQRLAIATALWLLAIWLYDRERPRLQLNILTASAGIALACLSLHGVAIRIGAYGLSEDRAYALYLILALLIAHGGLLLKMLGLCRRNAFAQRAFTATIALLAACTLATALLPLPRWILASQVARYTSGGADPAELANTYLFRNYGKAGEQAITEIRAWHGDSDAVTALKEAGLPPEEQKAHALARFRTTLQTFPGDYQPDEATVAAAYETGHDSASAILLQTDADHDGTPEALLLLWDGENYCRDYRYDSAEQRFDYNYNSDTFCTTDPAAALRAHGIQYQRPRYDDVVIGNLRLNLNTNP